MAYYYGQKAIRAPWARRALGACVAAFVPSTPKITDERSTRHVDQLEKTGFSVMPEKALSADALLAIRTYLRGKPAVDFHGSGVELDPEGAVPARFKRMAYSRQVVAGCPELVALATDPEILRAVGQYIGAVPTLSDMQLWWTYGENNPTGEKLADDIFHRDADDLRFVKMFVYLTDADVQSGAHCFVLGSHRSSKFTARGALTDEQVQTGFPQSDVMTVVGAAGTAFLEDTWGIHRPLLATKGRRLIFSAVYTLWAQVPIAKEPSGGATVLASTAQCDPYVIRRFATS